MEIMAIAGILRDMVSEIVLESTDHGALAVALAGSMKVGEGFVAAEAGAYGCSARVICAT